MKSKRSSKLHKVGKPDPFTVTISDEPIRRIVLDHRLIEENAEKLLAAIRTERLRGRAL